MMDLLTCDDADTEEGDDHEASGELPCRGAATRPGTGEQGAVHSGNQGDTNCICFNRVFLTVSGAFPVCKQVTYMVQDTNIPLSPTLKMPLFSLNMSCLVSQSLPQCTGAGEARAGVERGASGE